MKELAKSMISFSWALGLAGIRGIACLFDRDRREKFLTDSERILQTATQTTVDTLGRNLRETFQFGDEFQRRTIDAAASLSRGKPTPTTVAGPPDEASTPPPQERQAQGATGTQSVSSPDPGKRRPSEAR